MASRQQARHRQRSAHSQGSGWRPNTRAAEHLGVEARAVLALDLFCSPPATQRLFFQALFSQSQKGQPQPQIAAFGELDYSYVQLIFLADPDITDDALQDFADSCHESPTSLGRQADWEMWIHRCRTAVAQHKQEIQQQLEHHRQQSTSVWQIELSYNYVYNMNLVDFISSFIVSSVI